MTLHVFPDAVAAGIGVIRDGLAGRPEAYAKDAVVTNVAPEAAIKGPLVHVAKDSDRMTWPVVSRCLLRVTAWHHTAENAHDLAQLCQALLLAHSGPNIAACRPEVGPISDRDPDFGDDFATFTLTATLRSVAL